jgi:hypothetical protein
MAIYMLSCTGIAMNSFYCCGRLASLSFTFDSSDHNSEKSGKKNNCCKHEKQSFKIKDSHSYSASQTIDHPHPVIVSAASNWTNEIAFILFQPKLASSGNDPPDHPGVPIYTFNCTYRI